MALALVGMFFQTSALLPAVAVFAGLGVLAFVVQGVCWFVWSLIRRPFGWSPYLTDHRSGWIWMMCAVLVGTVGIYTQIGKGVELFPEVEAPADLHQCRDGRRLQPRRFRWGGSAHRGTDRRHR